MHETVPKLMKQFYPDYKPCLAKNELIEELKKDPSKRKDLNV